MSIRKHRTDVTFRFASCIMSSLHREFTETENNWIFQEECENRYSLPSASVKSQKLLTPWEKGEKTELTEIIIAFDSSLR